VWAGEVGVNPGEAKLRYKRFGLFHAIDHATVAIHWTNVEADGGMLGKMVRGGNGVQEGR
jgi:hypothetical protein